LVGLCAWSFAYLLLPQFHREDWRNLAVSLPTKTVYAIPSSMEALRYYRPDVSVEDIRNFRMTQYKIIVIPYTIDIYGLSYTKELIKRNYMLTNRSVFNGVSMEEWEQKK
jgi:hypothetical protein